MKWLKLVLSDFMMYSGLLEYLQRHVSDGIRQCTSGCDARGKVTALQKDAGRYLDPCTAE